MDTSTQPRVGTSTPGEGPTPRVRDRRKGRVLRFFGKTFLFAGFVLAAYLAWVLWGTGLYTRGEQETLRKDFQEAVAEADERQGGGGARPLRGNAYAILKIPAIGVNAVVIQGTELEGLKKGPGHYLKTADPWDDSGAVGIAGHRTTYGAWFWSLNELRRGDRIRLITARGTFDYEMRKLEIVGPGAVEVLDPTSDPTLVLTTCEPRFSAAQRLVAFADRVEREPGEAPAPEPVGGPGTGLLSAPEGPTFLVVAAGAGGAAIALLLGVGTAISRRRERRSEPVG
jgi:sortase A